MKYKELDNDVIKVEKNSIILKFLYKTIIGRIILKVVTLQWFSKFIGIILNSSKSKFLIKYYIKKYNIEIGDYEKYASFNDFFKRNMEIEKNYLDDKYFISTAESQISCYEINNDLILNIKNTKYSIKELIKDKRFNDKYKNGICIVYRLQPYNYHRYIYIDDGIQSDFYKIKRKLNTVNPISYERYKVFSENSREWSVLKTKNFGDIIQIEVGALCVGKIKNNHNIEFERYNEKGWFEFGGSTIIQLIEKDKILIQKEISENTKNNIETKVKIGQIIGEKMWQ